jgi:phosphoserine phosphatase
MTLYIIRHGETEMNKQGIVQGSGVDSDLNDTGQKQAHLFFQYYKNIPFDVLITSALKRTHQTVKPFILRGHQWHQTPDLNEISWGIHEGQKGSPQQHENYLRLMSDWESGNYHSSIEGGESALQLYNRVSNVLNDIKAKYRGKTVLLCTHGRTLLCLLTILKEQPLSNMNHHKHHNTCLYKVHWVDNEFVFELENDMRHLRG